MLSVYGEVTRLAGAGALTRPLAGPSTCRWWQWFFNAVASGPPGFRVRELLALSRAGFVDFLGAGMWVEVADGHFRAGSATLAGAPAVTAGVLVDARLPDPSAARTTDALLADLLAAGAVDRGDPGRRRRPVLRNTGLIRVRPADGALIDASGAAHPRRFAVGPHTIGEGGRRVHPPRHERAEPALQRRRSPAPCCAACPLAAAPHRRLTTASRHQAAGLVAAPASGRAPDVAPRGATGPDRGRGRPGGARAGEGLAVTLRAAGAGAGARRCGPSPAGAPPRR